MKGLIVVMLVLGLCSPVFADNINDFLRGDEPDEKLLLDYGIAKRFEIDETKPDVILELRREHEIDNFRTADYTVRTTVEF